MVINRTALAALVAFAMAGCSTLRENPTACKALTTASGAIVGGALGGTLVGEFEGGTGGDSGEIAAGTAGGFVGGGLVGYLIGHYVCPEEAVAAPPPPPPPPAKGTKIAEIPGPNFDFNKSTLTAAGKGKVAEAAQILKNNPTIHAEVAGYTDSIGSEKYNMGLSERRARTVADELVKDGISASRLTPRGYGKTHPIADNNTDAGRARNRRVELIVD